jgi:lipopolysaccharide transport system permease protein
VDTAPSIQAPTASVSGPDSPFSAPATSRSSSGSPLQVVIIEARSGWRLFDWREIVEYRDLLYFLVLRDVTVLYKQTVLGFAWAILTPFFSMVVFSVIFGRLLHVGSDGVPYPVFSFAALLPWTYFSAALTLATGSLITGTGIFTKVYFPRVFIPLTPIFSKLVDFGIAFVMLIGLMIYFKVVPSWNVVFLPVLILLMMATAAGLGMFLSALAVQYRDVRHAMNFMVQILMYAAPVVWPVSKIPEAYRIWYGLYPMAGVIEGFRAAILNTGPMPWSLIGMGAISAALCFVVGALFFRRTERFFADVA